MGWLTGRVAVVTGASKGIGRVTGETFAAEGAAVVCAARSSALVEETAARIRDAGGQAIAVTADLSREDEVRKVFDAGLAAFGYIDCLVNNAGDGGPTTPVQDYTLEDFRVVVESCLVSSFLCAKAAVPAMLAAGRGAIVNIGSMAGRRGMPFRVGYASAKAGQLGLTVSLALELGRNNITVNAILPGAVEGDRIERAFAGQAAARGTTPEAVRQFYVERSPLKKLTTAEDIAWAAVFLCSDHARAISGQWLPVNAGEPAS